METFEQYTERVEEARARRDAEDARMATWSKFADRVGRNAASYGWRNGMDAQEMWEEGRAEAFLALMEEGVEPEERRAKASEPRQLGRKVAMDKVYCTSQTVSQWTTNLRAYSDNLMGVASDLDELAEMEESGGLGAYDESGFSVEDSLADLPESVRAVFEAHPMEARWFWRVEAMGESIREIAPREGVSKSSISSRLTAFRGLISDALDTVA